MRERDITVARLAAGQHGLVTVWQLGRCGLDAGAIARRVAAGRLHRVHRGIYAVGHPGLGVEARYLAAAWAGGPHALVSHRAAAFLHGLVRDRSAPPPEVLVPFGTPRSIPGVTVHRTRVLHPSERRVVGVVPVTSVVRTLADLAPGLSDDDLGWACHQAHVRHHVTAAMVEAVLDRAPNRAGARRLRRMVVGDDPVVLSRLERRFLRLLGGAGLPRPATNRRAPGGYVDCRWPAHRLVVELDSYRFHATRRQWEEDLRRAQRARAAGDEHRRYAWGDVFDRPEPMLAEIAALLARPL